MDPHDLLAARTRVLELIAAHADLGDVLHELCAGLDRSGSDVMASVLLLDPASRTLHPAAGPSIPAAYLASVDGVVIGPAIGTCGSAAWSGEPQFTEDVAVDPRWEPIREFVMSHGIRRSWSWPILSARGAVLGTLAFYGAAPGLPDGEERTLLRDSACLAAIAIERSDTIRRLTADARIDPLTGLPNRRGLMAGLADALARASTERPTAVLFGDLDGLKTLNDTLGHGRTDAIIRAVAERLARAAGDGVSVGRLAGDEFVAVCPDTDAAAAGEIAERLLAALDDPIAGSRPVFVSMSLGVMLADAPIEPGEALRCADRAMYEAKRAGGAGWAMFEGSDAKTSRRRAMLRRHLDGAETRGELQLRDAPIVSLADGATIARRVRASWLSPELGEVPFAEFAPVAIETGRMVGLGAWLLRAACEALAPEHELDLVLRLHPLQLAYPGFARSVTQVLGHATFPARRLVLELHPVSLLDPDPAVDAARADLRAAGARLVLCDADSAPLGVTALVALARAKIDGFTVGPATVAALGRGEPVARATVGGLARLARAWGRSLHAEGVSDASQRDALRALGCDTAHGPLFSAGSSSPPRAGSPIALPG